MAANESTHRTDLLSDWQPLCPCCDHKGTEQLMEESIEDGQVTSDGFVNVAQTLWRCPMCDDHFITESWHRGPEELA